MIDQLSSHKGTLAILHLTGLSCGLSGRVLLPNLILGLDVRRDGRHHGHLDGRHVGHGDGCRDGLKIT